MTPVPQLSQIGLQPSYEHEQNTDWSEAKVYAEMSCRQSCLLRQTHSLNQHLLKCPGVGMLSQDGGHHDGLGQSTTCLGSAQQRPWGCHEDPSTLVSTQESLMPLPPVPTNSCVDRVPARLQAEPQEG